MCFVHESEQEFASAAIVTYMYDLNMLLEYNKLPKYHEPLLSVRYSVSAAPSGCIWLKGLLLGIS
jgi:hypothetical protein